MSERQAKEQNRKQILWVKNSKGLCTCFRNTQTEEIWDTCEETSGGKQV